MLFKYIIIATIDAQINKLNHKVLVSLVVYNLHVICFHQWSINVIKMYRIFKIQGKFLFIHVIHSSLLKDMPSQTIVF